MRANLNTILVLVAGAIPSVATGQMVELLDVRLNQLEGAQREQFLAAHNVARKEVMVAPVGWSNELSKHAHESLELQKDALIDAAKQGWTKRQMALPEHRRESQYGENLAAWAGTKAPPAEWAVGRWLKEKQTFDKLDAKSPYRVGDEEGQSEVDDAGQEQPLVVGHYTAIVWRATTEIGAAKLEFTLSDGKGDRRTYVAIVCAYNPPGNRRGERPY